MILFFKSENGAVTAVETAKELSAENINSLVWLFSDAALVTENGGPANEMEGIFVGPRREMITPWSTTAVEITQNMNIDGIKRIEEFFPVASQEASHDKMLQRIYNGLDQKLYTID